MAGEVFGIGFLDSIAEKEDLEKEGILDREKMQKKQKMQRIQRSYQSRNVEQQSSVSSASSASSVSSLPSYLFPHPLCTMETSLLPEPWKSSCRKSTTCSPP
ncbi:MAG: hypothetical protein WCV62_02175 [Candidatus Peribacteraceae bacterium]